MINKESIMNFILSDEERIVKQKKIADDVLQKLFPIDPYVVCAGGAPRDWYFEKPASDIDIFIYQTAPIGVVQDMLESVGLTVESAASAENLPEWYKLNPELRTVFNVTIEGEAVQIMAMNKPTFESVVPNFPLSICAIWYKNGKLKADKAFHRSVKHKIVVKTNNLYSNQHAYMQKIMKKFPSPEWKHFENWERAAQHVLDA